LDHVGILAFPDALCPDSITLAATSEEELGGMLAITKTPKHLQFARTG